ncbi:hypothetical protein MHU86_1343 [Fragilaria crotonensis]|nr:hypothetical protein MHU86_1343 [Fragilaria crotonensis]
MNTSNTPAPYAVTITGAADCTTAPASLEKSKRGPAFTHAEDVIVARAFIAASENAICGAHQKGNVFKLHMFELYKELINEQNRANQTLLEQLSNVTRDEYLKRGVGVSLSYRSPESVFNRFKSQISPEEDSLGKRPIGKKKARQAEADAKLVKAIISEVVVKNEKKVGGSDSVVSAFESSGESGGVNSTTGGAGAMMGNVLQNISSVIVNVGTALFENMKAEQDMRLVQSLDTTPDRKMYAKEQLALRLAETRDQRRRMEFRNRGSQQY